MAADAFQLVTIPDHGACPTCGDTVPQFPGGRERIYCGDLCRYRGRSHPDIRGRTMPRWQAIAHREGWAPIQSGAGAR